MEYYKNTQGGVFAFETEDERNEWGAPDLVKMTQSEIYAHINPKPTTEQLSDQARAKRDHLINGFIWRINRHRDEVDLGLEPTEPIEPLLHYVQALRDVPSQQGFPDEVIWPEIP